MDGPTRSELRQRERTPEGNLVSSHPCLPVEGPDQGATHRMRTLQVRRLIKFKLFIQIQLENRSYGAHGDHCDERQ